jgi:hypothetical protein
MTLLKGVAIYLCLELGVSSSALAAGKPTAHQTAVMAVAIEQRCEQLNPSEKISIQNLLSDKGINEETKAEIRTVSSDPRYKPEIEVAALYVNSPNYSAILPQMCKNMSAK